MNNAKLKRMNNKDLAIWWIHERESIRKKKKKGLPPPWTDCETMQNFSFCNVRRLDDKVSQWLLTNWYRPHYGHHNMLTAIVLARHINNIPTLETLDFPEKWNAKHYFNVLTKRKESGKKVFGNAYLVTGSLGGTKIYQVVHKVTDVIHKAKLRKELKPDSLEKWATRLQKFKGVGSFLSGQITADLRWAIDGKWEDKHSFAPMGPGSKKGINLFHGRTPHLPVSPKQWGEEFPDYMDFIDKHVDKKITKRLEAIDYQNTLCELSKLIKNVKFERRLKNRKNYA